MMDQKTEERSEDWNKLNAEGTSICSSEHEYVSFHFVQVRKKLFYSL
jgi:hypothetical protein